jgi:gas vesicle structural protein
MQAERNPPPPRAVRGPPASSTSSNSSWTVGIEILKIDVRIVIASVDTYLRFAEACNRLDLEAGRKAPARLTDIVGDMVESGARGKSSGVIGGALDAIGDVFDRDKEDER